jgi:hypothetical protein
LTNAESERAGSRIEPAPGARGAGIVDLPLQQMTHDSGCLHADDRSESCVDFVGSPKPMQHGGGHSPWFACCNVAAWEREWKQMIQPIPLMRLAGCIDPQYFASPCGSVFSKSHTVQGQSDCWATDCLLGMRHSDMRMMVLNRDRRNAKAISQGLRKLRAVHVWMKIVRHGLYRSRRLAQQFLDRVCQRLAVGGTDKVAMRLRP